MHAAGISHCQQLLVQHCQMMSLPLPCFEARCQTMSTSCSKAIARYCHCQCHVPKHCQMMSLSMSCSNALLSFEQSPCLVLKVCYCQALKQNHCEKLFYWCWLQTFTSSTPLSNTQAPYIGGAKSGLILFGRLCPGGRELTTTSGISKTFQPARIQFPAQELTSHSLASAVQKTSPLYSSLAETHLLASRARGKRLTMSCCGPKSTMSVSKHNSEPDALIQRTCTHQRAITCLT